MIRRDFVRYSSTLAISTSLIGNSQSWAGANDRIRVAQIGMGSRGNDHTKNASSIQGVEVAAVCDPDRVRAEKAADTVESLTQKRPQALQDVRRVLDDSSIDAVGVSTCNHWHALTAIWACQAGKHAYVEKPVSHNLWEGRKMVEAARKYNRIVQGGTQRRSSGLYRKAVQLLRDGVIGDLYMARALVFGVRDSIGFQPIEEPPADLNWDQWVGPAQMQPYHRNLVHYNWHWFWDFGNGELGNNGSHILDVIRWGLKRALPVEVHSTGGRFGYADQAETPNTQQTTYRFDDGLILTCETRGLPTNPEAEGIQWGGMFYGSKGYMTLDDSGYRIYLGRNKQPEPDRGKLESEDHFLNFINAIREGKPEMLNGDIEEVYLSCAYCLLGNIAYRLNRPLRFDPKTETFVGDEEANRLLTREYREPYAVPEKV